MRSRIGWARARNWSRLAGWREETLFSAEPFPVMFWPLPFCSNERISIHTNMNIHIYVTNGGTADVDPNRLVFAALFFVGGALLDYYLLWPYLLLRVASGEPGARVRVYRIIMGIEWLAAIFVIARWAALGRPRAALWLSPPQGWRLVAGIAAVLACSALPALQARSLARLTPGKRAALSPRLGSLAALLPHTAREYRVFVQLSVTAGICEELLYRGFLVWLLQPWLGLWWAAIVSVILFGAAHAYQGKRVLRPTLAGAVLGGMALLTRSILPGIVVHALVDVMGGTTGYSLLREEAAADPQTGALPEGNRVAGQQI